MHALWKLLLLHVLTCPQQHVSGNEIINGEKAKEGSMPYMASLQEEDGFHSCGGLLIREDFVLTAAHCADGLAKVVLGTQDLRNYGITRRIRKKYIHEKYSNETLDHDIMLLKLSRSVELNENVQTINLPSPRLKLRDNKNCNVAGWGSIGSADDADEIDELRVVNVSIINQHVCEEAWDCSLPDSVVCAGGYNTTKGFCQGDSGGPLVCSGVAVGIVSFNSAAAKCDYSNGLGLPNVYTSISEHMYWINSILNPQNE